MQCRQTLGCVLARLEEELGSQRSADLQLQSFETELLASDENLIGLMAVNPELVARTEAPDGSNRVLLDMGSNEMLGRIWALLVPGGRRGRPRSSQRT